MRQSEFLGILRQRCHLLGRYWVLDRFVLIVRRGVVVGHTIDFVRTETLQSPTPHAFKSLGRRHFVAIQAVDVQLRRSVVHLLHHVLVPYLIK